MKRIFLIGMIIGYLFAVNCIRIGKNARKEEVENE